jgi:hypothetical protein
MMPAPRLEWILQQVQMVLFQPLLQQRHLHPAVVCSFQQNNSNKL